MAIVAFAQGWQFLSAGIAACQGVRPNASRVDPYATRRFTTNSTVRIPGWGSEALIGQALHAPFAVYVIDGPGPFRPWGSSLRWFRFGIRIGPFWWRKSVQCRPV
jgi:hypothetical protein